MQETIHLLLSIAGTSDADARAARFRSLLDLQVSEEDFGDDLSLALFRQMEQAFLSHGSVPWVETLLATVEAETGITPQKVFIASDESSFHYWMEGFRESRLRSLIYHYATLLRDMAVFGVTDDISSLLREFSSQISRLTTMKKPSALLPLMEEVVEYHENLRLGIAEEGIGLGFPFIDRVTGGAQKGDLVVLIGTSGTGKTYILCRSAEHAATKLFKRVLFVTLEMTGFQIARRISAIGSYVNPTKLRLGTLDVFALDKVREYIVKWKERPAEDFLFIEGKVGTTISDIAVAVQEYRPDIVYIDGLYMLKPSLRETDGRPRWETVLNAVEELKQLAMGEKIPVVATTQYSRKGTKDGLEGVGYSYAIAQAASVGLSIEDPDGPSQAPFGDVDYKILRIVKNREGERGAVKLRYDMRHASITEDEVLEGPPEVMQDPSQDSFEKYA